MSAKPEVTLPPVRRARKSVGSLPSVKSIEKENATMTLAGSSTLVASRKKSRSKSIGPGGLDALKQSNGNRRVSLAVPSRPPPRSILKPSPIPEIPPHRKNAADLFDFGAKAKSRGKSNSPNEASGAKVAVRTEEEQQAAAREREERERRDARRKSLANRRVSFAAEATLHTFHEIEDLQDSTGSTDSTRRQSARTNAAQEAVGETRVEEPLPPSSGRSTGFTPSSSQETDETAMSLFSDDSAGDAVDEELVEDEGSNSDSDADDGTMMTVDDAEMTGVSAMSARTTSSEDSTLAEALRIASVSANGRGGRLLATEDDLDDGEEMIPAFVPWAKKNNSNSAAQNQSQPSASEVKDEDEDEDASEMEMDMEVTQVVGGIVRGETTQPVDETMDMTQAVGQILKPDRAHQPGDGEGEGEGEGEGVDVDVDVDNGMEMDMSMEVTMALGGIIKKTTQQAREPSPDEDNEPEEQSMEFTMAMGGIRQERDGESRIDPSDDTDMSMEMTNVLGGMLKPQTSGNIRTVVLSEEGSPQDIMTSMGMDMDMMDMDMDVGMGRIMAALNVEPEPTEEGDATLGMDMTAALGSIIKKQTAESRALSKRIMEAEVDEPDSPIKAVLAVSRSSSPRHRLSVSTQNKPSPSPSPATPKTTTPTPKPSATPQTRSNTPERAKSPEKESSPFRKSPARRSPVRRASPTRSKSPSVSRTPAGEPPTRQTRQSTAAARRSMSPEKAAASETKPASKPTLFQNDPSTGGLTPSVVLTPQKRMLSGVGIDRPGLGSPKVAAIFERRASIGDATASFVPTLGPVVRLVKFQDPRQDEKEEDRERREAHADEPPPNLRDMISSLSPKKKPFRARKSLHVGSASGLLGKRPIELDDDNDDDDDEERQDGVKRLKGLPPSPVKKIHLQPPEVATRVARPQSVEPHAATTPTVASPPAVLTTTPKHMGHFRDIDTEAVPHMAPLSDDAAPEKSPDRIHLQDFLNLTSIRFMELNTTKRRHTVAPSEFNTDDGKPDGMDGLSLERCVVAGACTVPMLELYQHSCRELRKYISEGRRIVREIENETHEDNPPLFREYMSAAPEFRGLMDTQFKNVKTHARLLSKAMWYEWRMKLQDGLKEGLTRIAAGMRADDEALSQQEELLESTLPPTIQRFAALARECDELQDKARELADCDPDELEAARNKLAALDNSVKKKTALVAKLRAQLQQVDAGIEGATRNKANCVEDIAQAEKIREECRGWSAGEVASLKARVESLEKQHGWSVTRMAGPILAMAYRREVDISFEPSTFATWSCSPVEVNYAGPSDANSPLGAEKQFFLHCIEKRVRFMQSDPARKLHHLLQVVKTVWDTASTVSARIARVGLAFPTTVVTAAAVQEHDSATAHDPAVAIRSSLLLVPLQSRVEITLVLRCVGAAPHGGVHVTVAPTARVVYGEHFNSVKIAEFLEAKIGAVLGQEGEEDWSKVLVELKGRLIARGKR